MLLACSTAWINTSTVLFFRLAVYEAKSEMHEKEMEKLKEEMAMKAAERVGK